MAPKTPGKKGTTKNEHRPSIQESAPIAALDYHAVQAEEVEALQAIFMEDYEDVKVETAWSKTSDRRFRVKIGAFSEPESAVTLSVHLTATYPRTVPNIEATGLEKFHERTQKRIRNVLSDRPRQLLGEVMIHAIATEIQEALEDAVQARQQGVLPSLEEERANAEEVATALAKQAEDAELQRQQEAQEEEQRILEQMVDQELNRRERRKVSKPAGTLQRGSTVDQDTIDFDQPALIQSGKDELLFSSVIVVGKDGSQLLARPLVDTAAPTVLVAVRKLEFRSQDRNEVLQLETVLDTVRKLRHPSLMSLYAFSMTKDSNGLAVTLCTEVATRGSLYNLLELSGPLPVDRARQWSINLLEGLEECHRHGFTHGCLSTKSISLHGGTPVTVKLADAGYAAELCNNMDLPSKWQAPDSTLKASKVLMKRIDIWALGVVIMQMCLGLDITSHSSPQSALDRLALSDSFEDLIERMCNIDSRRRPSAFDLLAAEFLRSDVPVLNEVMNNGKLSATGRSSPLARRSRHNSSNTAEPSSRYAQDFTEIGRLGKGGFGEVVKARNKLDGGVYAIKKISRAPQLDQILSEVMLLNRLNHPYVVRYFSTWVEESLQSSNEDASTATDDTLSNGLQIEFGFPSTGGLDFVSSSGYPQIEFGVDSDEDEDDTASDDSTVSRSEPLRLKKSRTAKRKFQSTLYIQMEYCERRTLRDLVRKGMHEDDCWRFMRQITEGLAHVHSHGIIHRDLKPDNIFIDVTGSPKIGDFGLATTNQVQVTDRSKTFSGQTSIDMTMSVGTAMYVAPELSSGAGSSYNEKVDMYSLGIIFFEMCEPFATAMERIRSLQEIRKKEHSLPPVFQANGEKGPQGKVISCLIEHKPSERPSSTELLRTGLLPVKIEDETIRQALSSLSDPRSPNHQKMMSALFAHEQPAENRVKALAWDAKNQSKFEDTQKTRLRAIARGALIDIFKLHGAEEHHREALFPRSTHYTAPNVFQMLDASGNLLQLPYDLTYPMARMLARDRFHSRCAFSFGYVYRDVFSGGPPTANEEVDFDIVSLSPSHNPALDEAELLRVLEDISQEPSLLMNNDSISFHINHAVILDAILDHCQVPRAQFSAVKECLSKLGFRQFNWTRIRSELRSTALSLPIATVDDLQQFDFRDSFDKAIVKLRDLMHSTNLTIQVEEAVEHIRSVLKYAEAFGVTRKIWLAPLSCFNAKFYGSGTLVQMVHDRKTSRDVLAAGGRYDGLVQSCKVSGSVYQPQGVVGISIGFDRLVANMVKATNVASKSGFTKDNGSKEPITKRCDVLLTTGASEAVRDAGMKILSTLWSSHVSTELALDGSTIDEQQYALIVSLRHEASTTVKVRSTIDETAEVDVPLPSLVSYVQQELRELQGLKRKQQISVRHPSQHSVDRKGNVQVLMSQHRSKKSNKYHIVEAAQQRWTEKLELWKDAPILAIETRDDVMELIRDTRLGDAESWRKALHSVPLNERQYLQQVQELLQSWRKQWTEAGQMREACVFNFRTGHGIYYDLGL